MVMSSWPHDGPTFLAHPVYSHRVLLLVLVRCHDNNARDVITARSRHDDDSVDRLSHQYGRPITTRRRVSSPDKSFPGATANVVVPSAWSVFIFVLRNGLLPPPVTTHTCSTETSRLARSVTPLAAAVARSIYPSPGPH